MSELVEIKNSKISGRGVFAVRPIAKGQVVFRWNLDNKVLRANIGKLPKEDLHFLNRYDDAFFVLLPEPERCVNHSCEPNTRVENFCDVAIRNIAPGEEITSDYSAEESVVDFDCRCGAKNCRNTVKQPD